MEQNMINQADNNLSLEDTLKGRYLTFWTEKQLYGVPIADVVQIIGVPAITPIPEYPYYAKGIISFRGSVTPVIDIRCRFDKEEVPYDDHTCIVVTNINQNYVGFIVDSVNEVSTVEDEDISKPPKMVGEGNGYLTGVGKLGERVVLLLDTSRVISEDELGLLTNAI